MLYEVFVPTNPKRAPQDVERGAPILRVYRRPGPFLAGQPAPRYRSFADACREATARGRRLRVEDGLLLVGYWDEQLGELRLQPGRARALSAWIGRAVDRRELEAADSLDNRRQAARQEMRQAYMRGDVARAAEIADRHGIRSW